MQRSRLHDSRDKQQRGKHIAAQSRAAYVRIDWRELPALDKRNECAQQLRLHKRQRVLHDLVASSHVKGAAKRTKHRKPEAALAGCARFFACGGRLGREHGPVVLEVVAQVVGLFAARQGPHVVLVEEALCAK